MRPITTIIASLAAPYYALRVFFYQRRLRKKIKRGRNISPAIGNPLAFMQALEQQHIAYSVLRWPEQISSQPPYLQNGDVDILVDADRKLLAPIIVRHMQKRGVKFDIYSAAPKRGTNYRGYSYYPPTMARQLLQHREKNAQGFYQLSGFDYIASLIYHLVYHKGSASGIELFANSSETSSYPCRVLLCRDDAPLPVNEVNPAHPLIDNQNFFYKFAVRDLINSLSPGNSNGIHSGDNLLESAYLLKTTRDILGREKFSA